LHDWIVAGAVFPGNDPEEEGLRQLDLVARNGCLLARSYVEAGFEAVMDYVVMSRERLDYWLDALADLTVRFVILAPGVQTAAERDIDRAKSKSYLEAYSTTIAARWAYLDAEARAELVDVGLWVNNATLTADETVEAILARRDEALIP
jgi:chloramphenicol 3-O-phosphotransferase